MAVNLDQVARDIRVVARAVEWLWERNAAPAGIRADADAIARSFDEPAIARVVRFLIDNDDPRVARRAAMRLDVALRQLTLKQKADIQKGLQQETA